MNNKKTKKESRTAKSSTIKKKALTVKPEKSAQTGLFRSVGMKLFLIFFCANVLLVVSVGWYSYSRSKAIIQRNAENTMKETVGQAAEKLQLGLKIFDSESMKIVTDPDLLSLFADWKLSASGKAGGPAIDQAAVLEAINNRLFAAQRNSVSEIAAIHVLPKGSLKPISTSSFEALPNKKNYRSEDWFAKTLESSGSGVWLDPKEKGYTKSVTKVSFGLARQMTLASIGDSDQILLFEIPLTSFAAYMSHVQIGKTGQMVVINDEGTVVYSEATDSVGKAGPLKLTPEELTAAVDAPVSKVIDIGGQKNLVVFKKMTSGGGWTIVTTVPIAELVKDTQAIRNAMWLSILIAALVALGVGLLVIGMIGRPLRSLSQLMHQAEQGDLTVAVKGRPRTDEIGRLGKSFNQMMGQITSLVDQTNKSASQVLSTAGELLNAAKQTTTSAKEIAVATEEIANGASSLAVEAERGNNLTHDIGDKMKQAVTTNRR
ncbi:HAMP domain-containing protein, partial [Gorillibacterium sp. sgz500922]|uniref:cache domain-containing protein n=1 Tax=Gorillibacterium sp. sgz500922 TaxID=3446694 RepID=UPI003F66380E